MDFLFGNSTNTTSIITSTLTSFLTTKAPTDAVPTYVGFIALTISVLFLGSNFLPVKVFETGI